MVLHDWLFTLCNTLFTTWCPTVIELDVFQFPHCLFTISSIFLFIFCALAHLVPLDGLDEHYYRFIHTCMLGLSFTSLGVLEGLSALSSRFLSSLRALTILLDHQVRAIYQHTLAYPELWLYLSRFITPLCLLPGTFIYLHTPFFDISEPLLLFALSVSYSLRWLSYPVKAIYYLPWCLPFLLFYLGVFPYLLRLLAIIFLPLILSYSFSRFSSYDRYFFIMATVFNLANVAPQTVGGYTRNTRAGLTGEALIKVKDSAVRKILDRPLSSNVDVSTFDPSRMKDKDNFFSVIGGWRADALSIRQHATAYYMHNVFIIASIGSTPRLDAQGNQVMDANGDPIMVDAVVEGDSLFDVWHNVSRETVSNSVRLYAEHAEDVDRQNLQWSWEFILSNIDIGLRQYVISEVENLPMHVGQTGPMAFYIVANKIVSSTNNLAHNVIAGVLGLELHHFEGEDVAECVCVLRNVLKFLNYGHAAFDRTPPTIMDLLVNVFLRASNENFVSYVRNLKNFHQADIATPEQLFSRVLEHYRQILTDPAEEWLNTRRHPSLFTGGSPPSKDSAGKKGKYIVDRTAPVGDEPRTRVNEKTGKEEHWCGKCPKGGRWGNHLSKDHDKWLAEYNKNKKRRSNGSSSSSRREDDSTVASKKSTTDIAPAPMGQVTYSSLFRGGYVSFNGDSDEDF